jgi:hypothetical protein
MEITDIQVIGTITDYVIFGLSIDNKMYIWDGAGWVIAAG